MVKFRKKLDEFKTVTVSDCRLHDDQVGVGTMQPLKAFIPSRGYSDNLQLGLPSQQAVNPLETAG